MEIWMIVDKGLRTGDNHHQQWLYGYIHGYGYASLTSPNSPNYHLTILGSQLPQGLCSAYDHPSRMVVCSLRVVYQAQGTGDQEEVQKQDLVAWPYHGGLQA